MTPIRPYQIAPGAQPAHLQPARPTQADEAKLAAARAFFAAAVGKPAAAQTVQAAAAAPAAPAAPQVQRTPDPAAPAPQKILRPGSLLDIRI